MNNKKCWSFFLLLSLNFILQEICNEKRKRIIDELIINEITNNAKSNKKNISNIIRSKKNSNSTVQFLRNNMGKIVIGIVEPIVIIYLIWKNNKIQKLSNSIAKNNSTKENDMKKKERDKLVEECAEADMSVEWHGSIKRLRNEIPLLITEFRGFKNKKEDDLQENKLIQLLGDMNKENELIKSLEDTIAINQDYLNKLNQKKTDYKKLEEEFEHGFIRTECCPKSWICKKEMQKIDMKYLGKNISDAINFTKYLEEKIRNIKLYSH